MINFGIMKFKNSTVEIKPVIQFVNHNQLYNYVKEGWNGNESVIEYKEILFAVSIKIGKSYWELPFLMLLSKYLKDEFLQDNNKSFNLSDQHFHYRKKRCINLPLFMISAQAESEVLLDFLMVLDLAQNILITSQEYNNVNSDLFLSSDDLENLAHADHLQYCIKKYYDTPKTTRAFFYSKKHWKVPYITLSERKIGLQILAPILDQSGAVWKCDNYNIVPKGYNCSFTDSFSTLKEFHYEPPVKEKLVYKGTFANCKQVFEDKQAISDLFKRVFKEEQDAQRRIQQEENEAYYNGGWQEDYFNAMTDGQLGDYNDFHGDLDDLDTWSRG